MPKMVENIIPILSCSDLAGSMEYYQKVLGFKVDWTYEGSFASVSRDDWKVFLNASLSGEASGRVWVGVEDIEALHDEFVAAGARIKGDMIDNPWAREMHVADLDGNILRFGGEPRANDS